MKRPRVTPRAEYFITTIPIVRPCRRCGSVLAAGIVDGLHTTIDLIGLDLTQQMMAILGHIELYRIRRSGIVHLDASRLTEQDQVRYPEHRCGVVWESRITPGGPVVRDGSTDKPPY